MKHRFAVMLIVETDDPGLSPEALNAMFEGGTASAVAKVRHRLTKRLPADIDRVVAVFAEQHAMLLMKLHEAVGEDIARELGVPSGIKRPPPDFVPPVRG